MPDYFPLPMPKWGNGAMGPTGLPLAGGKLYLYAAGTTSPSGSHPTANVTFPFDTFNPNPVVFDSEGRADIFVPPDTAYDLILTDSEGNQIWTAEGIAVPPVQAPPVSNSVPVGAILPYGAAAAPSGYLLCDGSPVSRATYNTLFALIGTTFGPGNGVSTFNVPDMRGRFPLGKAASGTGAVLGDVGGAMDHTHTGPSHTHTVANHHHTIAHTHNMHFNGWTTQVNTPPLAGILQAGGTGAGAEATVTQANADQATGASSAANSGDTALTTDASGTAATGSNNPPFQVFTFIIKT